MQVLGWFITLMSANLMFPLRHTATGERVCYSREQIDDRNVVVKRVPCDEQEHQVYKEFTSRENVNLADLMEVKCSLEDLPDVLNGKFKTSECTGRSIGDTCSLTCDDGYYTPLDTRQTACQDKGNNKAGWTPDSFSCHEVRCSLEDLPDVLNGKFKTSDCTGRSIGDTCSLTCDDGYYTPLDARQTTCQDKGNNKAGWIPDTFSCHEVKCSLEDLPDVLNGKFKTSDCTGRSIGDTCSLTCDDGYYSLLDARRTTCQDKGNNKAGWTEDTFSCHEVRCSLEDLPDVLNGKFKTSDCTGRSIGDTCSLTCDDGYYTPLDARQTTCQDKGNNEAGWTPDTFSCHDNFITQYPTISPSGDSASSSPTNPTDCYDIFTSGITEDGVYAIKPSGWTESPFDVYCNMSHDGGWTVFQRRVNGSVDFQFRDWEAYKEGFGFPSHEFWLGNEKLFLLTNQKHYKLRVDYVDRDGVPYYMNYDLFRVANETTKYQLELLGTFTGNSGYDYMVYHRGRPFTTRDRDHDARSSGNCAVSNRGGWWYGHCYSANLNGDYGSSGDDGVALNRQRTSIYKFNLRYTQMKIRPL